MLEYPNILEDCFTIKTLQTLMMKCYVKGPHCLHLGVTNIQRVIYAGTTKEWGFRSKFMPVPPSTTLLCVLAHACLCVCVCVCNEGSHVISTCTL